MPGYEDRLRSLALNDEQLIGGVFGIDVDTLSASELGPREYALVRLASLLALDAAPSSYQAGVETALASGSTADDILGVLIAIAPIVGTARIVSAAPELALALGYDVDEAFEEPPR